MFELVGRVSGNGNFGALSAYAARSYLSVGVNSVEGAAFGIVGRLVNEVTKPIFNYFFQKWL